MRPIDADALIKTVCETTLFIKDSVVFQRLIEEAPTIEPSDDLISRADAIEAVESANPKDKEYHYYKHISVEALKALPSANKPKGEWLYLETEPYSKCSVCGAYIDDLDDDKYNYCPYCGADMKGRCENE